jgi:hypothetical protein
VANVVNPNIIAKYVKNANGDYVIPTFSWTLNPINPSAHTKI